MMMPAKTKSFNFYSKPSNQENRHRNASCSSENRVRAKPRLYELAMEKNTGLAVEKFLSPHRTLLERKQNSLDFGRPSSNSRLNGTNDLSPNLSKKRRPSPVTLHRSYEKSDNFYPKISPNNPFRKFSPAGVKKRLKLDNFDDISNENGNSSSNNSIISSPPRKEDDFTRCSSISRKLLDPASKLSIREMDQECLKESNIDPSSQPSNFKNEDLEVIQLSTDEGDEENLYPYNTEEVTEIDCNQSETQGNQLGFHNLGNTCYMNSVLQVLLKIKPFIKTLTQHPMDTQTVYGNLKRLLCQPGINCDRYLKNIMRHPSLDFSEGEQHDAQEFLIKVLGVIDDELEAAGKELERLFETKLRKTTFCQGCSKRIQNEDTIKMLTLHIPLNSDDSSSLSIQSLVNNRFCNLEVTMDCDCLKSTSNAVQSEKLLMLPKILVVHLLRYDFDSCENLVHKLTNSVQVNTSLRLEENCNDDYSQQKSSLSVHNLELPENSFDKATLNLRSPLKPITGANGNFSVGPSEILTVPSSEMLTVIVASEELGGENVDERRLDAVNVSPDLNIENNPLTNYNYTLVGVVNHYGGSAVSGHYTSEVYDYKKKTWTCYNDTLITQSSEEDALNRCMTEGYLFFYTLNTC